MSGGDTRATANLIVWNFHDFHENTGFRCTQTVSGVGRLGSQWEAVAEPQGSRGAVWGPADSQRSQNSTNTRPYTIPRAYGAIAGVSGVSRGRGIQDFLQNPQFGQAGRELVSTMPSNYCRSCQFASKQLRIFQFVILYKRKMIF